MAYSAPSSVTTGDLVTASTWNQDVVDNVIALKALIDGLQPSMNNGSGATRSAGDVCIYNTGADQSFTTTTTVGDGRAICVVKDATIANGADGSVATAGDVVDVYCTTGAVARGDYLQTSATAGQAQTGDSNAFAIALEAKGAGSTGLVKAILGNPFGGIDGVRLYRSTLSISDGSTVTITWSGETYDPLGMWSSGTNIAIPVDGYYQISLDARFSNTNAGRDEWLVTLFKNTSATRYAQCAESDLSKWASVSINDVLSLTTSDYLAVKVYANNDGGYASSLDDMIIIVRRIG